MGGDLPWQRFAAVALTLIFSACASFPVDTDAPPAREVMPVPEFSDLRDYRGSIDLRLRDSGYDQSSLAELARDTQFDFICLTDEVTSKSADYGAGGFTNEVLFIPGGAFRIGGGEAQIVGINLRDPISPDQSAPKVIE